MFDSEESISQNERYDDDDEERNEEEGPFIPSRRSNGELVSRNFRTSSVKLESLESNRKTFTISNIYGLIDSGNIAGLNQFFTNSLSLISNDGDDSLLMTSVSKGSLNCFGYLLDNNVDIVYSARDGETALSIPAYAWTSNSEEMIRRLVIAGADLYSKNNKNQSPCEVAFIKGRCEMIKVLVEMGFDLNRANPEGMHPIQYCLKNSNKFNDDFIDWLISKFCDDNNDEFLIKNLTNNGKESITDLLSKLCGHPSMLFKKIVYQMGNDIRKEHQQQKEKWEQGMNDIFDYFDPDLLNIDVISTLATKINKDIKTKLNEKLNPIISSSRRLLFKIIENKCVENLGILLEEAEIDINDPSSLGTATWNDKILTPLEYAILLKNSEIIKLLLNNGANVDPRKQDWINFMNNFDCGRSIFSLITNNIIRKHPYYNFVDCEITRSNRTCNCSKLARAIKNNNANLVENILYNGTAIKEFKCNYNKCHFNYGIYYGFYNSNFKNSYEYYNLDRNYSKSEFEKDQFRILSLLLKFGFNINNQGLNYKNLSFSHLISNCKRSVFFSLLEEYGFNISRLYSSIFDIPKMVRKWTICWSKTSIFKIANIDKEEYGTEELIVDIPDDEFIVLNNEGRYIVWDINSLYNYVTYTVQGVNEYDSGSPWSGTKILTSWDIRRLSSFNDKGNRLANYMKISDHIKILCNIQQKLEYCGSIFSARGDIFEAKLIEELNDREKEEWLISREDIPNPENGNEGREPAMPRMDPSLARKIEKLKRTTMTEWYEIYNKMTSKEIESLNYINDNLNPENFTKMFNGNYCVMSIGHNMIRAHKRLTQWND
tara:strand:- start:928 stop:3411 length:2484 start_codon:yes stop_codon:yes gene_type:complete